MYNMLQKKKMKIAFLLLALPKFNETYITNEVLSLKELGIEGHIWYRHTSEKKGEIQAVFPCSCIKTQLWDSKLPLTCLNHITFFLRHPLAYCKAARVLSANFTIEHFKIFLRSLQLAKEIQQQGCEVIYVHDWETAGLYGIFAKYFTHLPAVIIFHTTYVFADPKLLRLKICAFDRCIFQSTYTKKFVCEKLRVSQKQQEKMVVIHLPGVDTQFFSRDNENKTSFSNQEIRLVSVGRLEEMKGFVYLLDAIFLLKKKGYQVICHILGTGSEKRKLEKKIDKLHLGKSIFLAGKIPHNKKFLQFLQNGDIFVLPSIINKNGDRDVLANAIQEAMSTELVVITSQLGGIEELIENKKNGFLIENVTPEILAEKIRSIYLLPQEIKREIGERARHIILMEFSKEKASSHLVSLLRNLIEVPIPN